jgi:hypothetical protein
VDFGKWKEAAALFDKPQIKNEAPPAAEDEPNALLGGGGGGGEDFEPVPSEASSSA